MSRVVRVMQAFQYQLKQWAPHIEKLTFSKLSFTPIGNGDFKIVATWSGGHLEKVYDKQEVFGGAAMQRAPRQRVCRFSDELAKAILQARGV